MTKENCMFSLLQHITQFSAPQFIFLLFCLETVPCWFTKDRPENQPDHPFIKDFELSKNVDTDSVLGSIYSSSYSTYSITICKKYFRKYYRCKLNEEGVGGKSKFNKKNAPLTIFCNSEGKFAAFNVIFLNLINETIIK